MRRNLARDVDGRAAKADDNDLFALKGRGRAVVVAVEELAGKGVAAVEFGHYRVRVVPRASHDGVKVQLLGVLDVAVAVAVAVAVLARLDADCPTALLHLGVAASRPALEHARRQADVLAQTKVVDVLAQVAHHLLVAEVVAVAGWVEGEVAEAARVAARVEHDAHVHARTGRAGAVLVDPRAAYEGVGVKGRGREAGCEALLERDEARDAWPGWSVT
jgi:hypothetical protein